MFNFNVLRVAAEIDKHDNVVGFSVSGLTQKQAFKIINLTKYRPIEVISHQTNQIHEFVIMDTPSAVYLDGKIIGLNAYDSIKLIVDDQEVGILVKKYVRKNFFSHEMMTLYNEASPQDSKLHKSI